MSGSDKKHRCGERKTTFIDTGIIEQFESIVSNEERLFCKCWGRRKQRSFGKNQMRTAF